jgi:3'-phosphoadenosine 5'-phosphosulfate sulfotransferase (PAPS reductase)/FAD synthetase
VKEGIPMVSRKDDRLAPPGSSPPTEPRLSGGRAGPGLAEKLLRALALLYAAREQFGDRLAVERDLSRDSCVVWELARRVDPGIKGFFVAARLRAEEEARIAEELTDRYPEIRLHGAPSQEVPDADPGLCRRIAEARANAIREDGVECWVSGLRAPTSWPWFSLGEFRKLDTGLSRLCPILDWSDEDALRYAASRKIAVPVCK